jgi:hypothetical protein
LADSKVKEIEEIKNVLTSLKTNNHKLENYKELCNSNIIDDPYQKMNKLENNRNQ